RLAAAVDDAPTRRAVEAERTLLQRLGGGCLSALGAYALAEGDDLTLQAVVLDASGRTAVRASARGRDDAGVVNDVAIRLGASAGWGRSCVRRIAIFPHIERSRPSAPKPPRAPGRLA